MPEAVASNSRPVSERQPLKADLHTFDETISEAAKAELQDGRKTSTASGEEINHIVDRLAGSASADQSEAGQ